MDTTETIRLPDGTIRGLGLLIPQRRVSAFPVYETVGPMLSRDDIVAAAKTGAYRGSTKFDESFIKNQRNHGSCNGFAEAMALTRARIRRLLPRVDLSGAYAYSLINGGQDQGSMLDDGMKACMERGIATEATVKWNQIYRSQYDRAKADAEAALYRGFECYAVETDIGLWSALVNNFDCVVAVHADNGFMRVDANGVAGGGNGPGNHAVGADGIFWTGSTLAADGFNSWDVTYGNRGRMGMTWEQHFRSTFKYHVFYAIRGTTDGQRESEPPVANV